MKSLIHTYKNNMKNVSFFLLFCAIFLSFSLIVSPFSANAASWQWTKTSNNRERLVIKLDEPMPNLELKRNDGLSLNISTPLQAKVLTMQGANPSDSFVKSVEIVNGDFKVNMNSAGFGYILVSPENGSLIELEFYPDPLMERFYPATPAPVATTAPTTAPVATATPTPAPVAEPVVSIPSPTTAQVAPITPSVPVAPVVSPSPATTPIENPQTLKTLEETSETTPVAPIPDEQDPDNTNALTEVVAPPSISISPLEAMKNPPEDLQRNPHTAGLLQSNETPATSPAPITPIEAAAPEVIAPPTIAAQPVAPIAEVVEAVPAVPIAPIAEATPAPIAPVEPVQEPAPVEVAEVLPVVEQIAPIIDQEPALEEAPNIEEEIRPEAMVEALVQTIPPSSETANQPTSSSDKIFYGYGFTAPLKDVSHDSPEAFVEPTSTLQINGVIEEVSFIFDEAPPPIAYYSDRSEQVFAFLQQSVSQNNKDLDSFEFTGTLLALNSNEFLLLAENTASEGQTSAPSDINSPAPALGDVAAPDLEALQNNNAFPTEPVTPAPAPTPAVDPTMPTMPMTPEEAMQQGRPVIYQDPEGNVIEAPPNPDNLLPALEQLMASFEYEQAILLIEDLMTLRLHNDDNEHIKLKEKLLYDYARALFSFHKEELDVVGQKVIDASITAMNYNLKSQYVPPIIDMIVRTHIAMNNIDDAEGYILMLQELYPQAADLIPQLLLYLANIQLDNAEYAKAVITTQRILDNYMNSPYVQEGSIVQTKAFYKQGHYDKALPMITFINMRWPDSYLRFPEYLSIVADVQIAQQLYNEASDTLWTEYNLDPNGKDAPNILNRLAILYYSQADFEGAAKVQLELINSFPDHPEVPSALIRIAENSFQAPNPPLDTLLALFSVPSPRIPSITYQQVIDNYPNTIQAIESETRLAAWHFFHQEYDKAMDYAVQIMEKYPDRAYFNTAQDVLLRSFSLRLENALLEENVSRALDLWERYPGVQNYYLPLEDDLRVALARGYLNRGDSTRGLEYLQRFISSEQDEKYGIYAYNLFLNQYLNQGQWQAILDLDEEVSQWNMPLDIRNQHNYTVALASENLGMSTRAIPLWRNIVNVESTPLYQRAYANYFLARDAENKQDLRGTYQHNLDALAMFEQLAEEKSEFSDPPRIRESIAALMDVTEVAGRFAEALDWLNKYTPFIPEDSPDYAGLQLREARLYKKMGDTNKWRVVLRDIIQREPDSVFGTMAASELKADQLSRDIERFVQ